MKNETLKRLTHIIITLFAVTFFPNCYESELVLLG